jgi:3-phenylpropionate/cinnamic acid dioxygenase small subunit
VVGGVLVGAAEGTGIAVRASWIVHSFGLHGGITRSGSYDYVLREEAGELKIARKKITMIDDKLVGPVDIFHL